MPTATETDVSLTAIIIELDRVWPSLVSASGRQKLNNGNRPLAKYAARDRRAH